MRSPFTHGFVRCPDGDDEEVICSANDLTGPKDIHVTAEAIDAPFYSTGTMPILVKCEWMTNLEGPGSPCAAVCGDFAPIDADRRRFVFLSDRTSTLIANCSMIETPGIECSASTLRPLTNNVKRLR